MQRLKVISFLGAVDYTTNNDISGSRFEHSIVVATIAQYACSIRQYDAMDLRTVFKNMDTTLTLCPDEHQSVVSEFFNKRIDEYRRELIKSQTLRIESSSIRRLYENFVRFSDLNIAIIQLAAEAPGLECSLTAYLNFTEAIIQLSWPSLAISTQYRLAYLINKFRRCPLRDAELCEFVRCFLLHFYGESVAKGSFSIRTEDNELIVLANRKDFWVASPSREH